MSLAKQRVKSANCSQEPPKRRYDKVNTENSQELRPPSAGKIRSYSRNESKKSRAGARGVGK